jgi:hypothetical protein
VADGTEQRLLELLASQDDDPAVFHEEAGGAAGFFLPDRQEWGAAHGDEFDAAAAVAVVALAIFSKSSARAWGQLRRACSMRSGQAMLPSSTTPARVVSPVTCWPRATWRYVSFAASSLRPGNRMVLLLFVVDGQVSA